VAKLRISKKGQLKKQLKEPDQFITFSRRLLNYVSNNVKTVVSIFLIILVAAAILVGLRVRSSMAEKKALTLYYKAHQEHGSLARDLQQLIDTYPKTAIAKSAFLELGNIYYKNADLDKAIVFYQRYLKESSYGEMRVFAYDSLGHCFESKQDYLKASEYFKKILQEKGNFLKEMAYVNLGRVYQKAGKIDEAIRNYEEFAKKYPYSPQLPLIEDKLSRLRQER
jgi:tetratricopeptide (TPR) repeat protein